MHLSKFVWLLLGLVSFTLTNPVLAERISDIRNTKHNFSAAPEFGATLPTGQSRSVRATSEQQICVFCHTPHGAEPNQGPLWNRQLSLASYDTYNSGSLDATPEGVALDQPNGVSKLCLSCHDGTMAIGAVNVLNGTKTDGIGATQDIAMQGTGAAGVMPAGEGERTGFTRYLGTNLTNDHPISLVYDSQLATADGEMRVPDLSSHLVVRGTGTASQINDIHLEPTGQTSTGGLVQCNSCHDPHIRDTNDENIKFLRLNRLQKVGPTEGPFSKQNDIICLACHDKDGWANSAHANPLVADERYTNAAAAVREFANGTQVWETACLACHDTHSVEGSRRLLREGTDGMTLLSSSGYTIKLGDGQAAIEETCYACHSASLELSANLRTLQGQGSTGFQVPDVKTDFTTMATRMPISNFDQPAGMEVHDIGSNNPDVPNTRGRDFVENPTLLGRGNLNNRHVECTDCHNPHRVIKNRRFNDDPAVPGPAGTHDHAPNSGGHTNIASGVLKGMWGVEPVYGSNAFGQNPMTFTVKRGDPGINSSTAVGSAYVTREYQICLKCHSNYAYGNTPPDLGSFNGGTAPGTNGMLRYTNQAMEYNSPDLHANEPLSLGVDGGAGNAPNTGNNPNWNTFNHRSWHPVMRSTGRTAAERNADAGNWLAPFNNQTGINVGNQTMYCTDCHGSDTGNGTAVPNGGENGSPWGPHGSNNNFILKGDWSGDRLGGTGELQGSAGAQSHLCFKCHDFDQYANPAAALQDSGFGGSAMCGGMCGGGGGGGGMGGGGGGMGGMNNLHIFHANQVTNFRCNLCHVAVPHGWKNKNFLANLNDIGAEASNADRGEVRLTGATYTNPPYYNRAALKINTFAQSGAWSAANCGSSGSRGNGQLGINWMAFSSESCDNVP